jgi:hypothetical protein
MEAAATRANLAHATAPVARAAGAPRAARGAHLRLANVRNGSATDLSCRACAAVDGRAARIDDRAAMGGAGVVWHTRWCFADVRYASAATALTGAARAAVDGRAARIDDRAAMGGAGIVWHTRRRLADVRYPSAATGLSCFACAAVDGRAARVEDRAAISRARITLRRALDVEPRPSSAPGRNKNPDR